MMKVMGGTVSTNSNKDFESKSQASGEEAASAPASSLLTAALGFGSLRKRKKKRNLSK